ncbi:DUF1987 domain-containing protein [Paenibacillus ginsengarvi]|uniref:DUF1987 domain-containing protein n=1 Tax=Paenibacillus ginsengarvi TaxID=400777 RepID=A0A3B0C3F4_9BACL|nr:DUF1987 domain-containing protein [Paenibacillus ginsengarvi]RKN79068.1 DUF1987 domain-containing protein [Paenibacillus ginsengarvi]
MQPYYIEGTKSSPAVAFDPVRNRLALNGQSYPENPFKFYEPILEWLTAYLAELPEDAEAVAEFQIPYMNTSSTKCLLMLLDKLEAAYLQGKRVSVLWTYNRDNESEYECAEELKEDLSLPFHIIAKEDR